MIINDPDDRFTLDMFRSEFSQILQLQEEAAVARFEASCPAHLELRQHALDWGLDPMVLDAIEASEISVMAARLKARRDEIENKMRGEADYDGS